MDLGAAIIDQLKRLAETRDLTEPIGLYAIGVPLINAGFDQHEIVNVLFQLERDKVIGLLPYNSLRLVHALTP
jgi:hypothetical protein